MKKLTVFFMLVVVFFYSGCKYAPFVGLLGTPSYHEREVPAEYDLAEHTDRKILVFVNQPAYLNAQANLRFHLTKAINKYLIRNVGILPEHVVSYSELSEFRSAQSDFSLLSPVEVGTAFDANMVLLVVLEDYQLDEIAETGYHKGFLSTRTVLFDTAGGEKLWPKSAKSKSIKVGFEFEDRGREVAIARLVTASAYCTVRYLYDCPKNKFRITEDKSRIGWENWRK